MAVRVYSYSSESGTEFESHKKFILTESSSWKSYLPSFFLVFFLQYSAFCSILLSSQLYAPVV